MISHEHKCIFIHIPKCAGTSIEHVLGHLKEHNGRGGQDHRSVRLIEQPFPNRYIFSSRDNCIEALRRPKHRWINQSRNYRNKFRVNRQQFTEYYKFTVVRNPWERTYSWYRNVMRDEIHQQSHGVTNDITFEDFLVKFAGKGMIKSQLYWLKSFDGKIALDYIARFENLKADVDIAFKELDLDDVSLPHEIKGSGDDYRSSYNKEMHKIIETVYSEEIKMFGYKFDS